MNIANQSESLPSLRPPVTLAFLHIPKTAGTSLTQALLGLYSWTHVLSQHGNIDFTVLEAYRRLPKGHDRGSVLVHGHAGHASFDTLANAVTLTVIRDPVEHAISNYLYVRREPDTPLHGQANTLPFDQFLRLIWQFIVFQSISLDVMVSTTPTHSIEDFHHRAEGLPALLERIDLVGVTESLQTLLDALARRLAVVPPLAPNQHRADEFGVTEADRAVLRAQYHQLADDPKLAPLFAAEQALYEAASCRSSALRPAPPVVPRLKRWISRIPRPASLWPALAKPPS